MFRSTRQPRPWARAAVVAGVAAVLVAPACSGPDEGGTDTTTPATTPSAGATAPPATAAPATSAPTTVPAPTMAPTTAPAGPGAEAIRSVDFASQVLPADSCGSLFAQPPAGGYRLQGGEARAGSPGDADFYSVAIRPDPAIGDLDGDGREDAVVVVDCSTGTTPVAFAWVFAPGSEPGSIERLGAVDLGADDRARLDTFGDPRLTGVAIEGSSVATTWATHAEGDPICCPTGQTTVTFTWSGSAFTPT